MNPVFVRKALAVFLEEDFGHVPYDRSSDPTEPVEASIEAQEAGVMCGGDLLLPLFVLATPDGWVPPEIVIVKREGEAFAAGDVLARLRVHPEALRNGIRTALNLLQHLCGVATRTRELVSRIGGNCTLLDTRKTTPGLRTFEKYAAKVGGAKNHRFGRYDGVMLKKEDIALAGGLKKAIDAAVLVAAHLTAIEVEVENLDDLTTVLFDGRVRHVMLDNMTPHQVNQAVAMTGGKLVLEASGIDPDRLAEYAATGVPFISTSAMIATARKTKMHLRF